MFFVVFIFLIPFIEFLYLPLFSLFGLGHDRAVVTLFVRLVVLFRLYFVGGLNYLECPFLLMFLFSLRIGAEFIVKRAAIPLWICVLLILPSCIKCIMLVLLLLSLFLLSFRLGFLFSFSLFFLFGFFLL